MLRARVSDNPDSFFRADGRKVGNELTQMGVVAFLKLVFNYH